MDGAKAAGAVGVGVRRRWGDGSGGAPVREKEHRDVVGEREDLSHVLGRGRGLLRHSTGGPSQFPEPFMTFIFGDRERRKIQGTIASSTSKNHIFETLHESLGNICASLGAICWFCKLQIPLENMNHKYIPHDILPSRTVQSRPMTARLGQRTLACKAEPKPSSQVNTRGFKSGISSAQLAHSKLQKTVEISRRTSVRFAVICVQPQV
ncbi:hypothetical protein RND71_030502 [Anisodus tanguticus]|uniref:Uncharacterized protein n=1 Tax=Anisodus tanguticus TaxID=243964 RepID=A0AAE1V7E4_9SOLA|nr:hypothetical protein RND71_030502 [Anisodus tanguticus]